MIQMKNDFLESPTVSVSEVPDDPENQDVVVNVEDEDETLTKCEVCQNKAADIVEKLHLRSFLPFIILIIYTCIGAGIFWAIERPSDIKANNERNESIMRERNLYLKNLVLLFNETLTNATYTSGENLYLVFQEFSDLLEIYEKNAKFKFPSGTIWNHWNSLLYAGTIYTTIGYGNIHCKTVLGQAVTIVYALFGIPLMLSTMNDIGKLLLLLLGKITVKAATLRNKIGRAKKKPKNKKANAPAESPEPPTDQNVTRDTSLTSLSNGSLNSTEVQLDTESPKDEEPDEDEEIEDYNRTQSVIDMEYLEENPPVIAAVLATIGWLFFCAGLFCIWETNWTYFTSFYFFFISLSTIGFGDVIPEHPEFMVGTFALVIIGLSLVTMCINVVQNKLEQVYMAMLRSMLGEYEELMMSGENAMGASMGMIQSWKKSPKARFLMPLLSASKAQNVMHEFQENAKAKGIALPSVFNDIDLKTGMPSALSGLDNQVIKINEEPKTEPPKSSVESSEKEIQTEPAPKNDQENVKKTVESSTVGVNTEDTRPATKDFGDYVNLETPPPEKKNASVEANFGYVMTGISVGTQASKMNAIKSIWDKKPD